MMRSSTFAVLTLLVSFAAAARARQPNVLGEPIPPAHVATHTLKAVKPRLLFPGHELTKARDPESAAREFLTRHDDVDGLVLDHVHDIGRGGIVVSFKRFVDGVEVNRDALHVLMRRDLSLVAIAGQVHREVPSTWTTTGDARGAMAVALRAVTHDERVRADDVTIASELDAAGYARAALADVAERRGGAALRHGRVKRVWTSLGDGSDASLGGVVVVPAYKIELAAARNGRDYAYDVVVDARDFHVIETYNITREAQFTYRVYADADGDKRPFDSPRGDTTPYPLAAPDGHYPDLVSSNLVTIDGFDHNGDPWIDASTTVSTGNNVDAFTDDANPVGFSAGDLRAQISSAATFDYALDTTIAAESTDAQKMAGVVSLFYLDNWLHDWWYDSGFDEGAHNGQTSNYGRGGVENDAIWALAQFAAPFARDNSAMSPFDDGTNPEQQMFVWSGRDSGSLTAAAQGYSFNIADFGPTTFDVEVNAIQTVPADACSAVTNDLTNQIALVDRGTCTFTQKIVNAQAAGALAVIIVDNQGGEGAPPVVGDPQVDPQPTIPVVSVSQADGQTIEAAAPIAIVLVRNQEPDFDGGFDTTVAAHEWMHYMHLRQVSCQQQQCSAQSEGWADFNALMTTTRAGDDLKGAYPVGVYDTRAFPDDPAYFGIRRYPYSTDESKNPLRLGLIADSATLPDASVAPVAVDNAGGPNSEAHATGEVWCEMMWESFVAVMGEFSSDFEGGRRRMGDIVEGAMQLAPADPTMTEMRDAVLASAETFDSGEASAIAAAFAKRGAGTCAVSPDRASTDNEGVVEDATVGGAYVIDSVTIDDSTTTCDKDGLLDGGEAGNVVVTLRNSSTAIVEGATIELSSTTKGLHFGQTQLSVGAIAPFDTASVSAQITLDLDAAPLTRASITAKIVGGPACDAAKKGLTITPLINSDDVKTGLKEDSVEGSATSWTTTGDFADQIWSINPEDDGNGVVGNHVWNGGDADAPTDTQLVSPKLNVTSGAHFTLKLHHRHSFEFDQASNYDGGVIEVSTDGGQTWADISTLTTSPGYEGLIGDTTNQAHNPLQGQQGFVAQNKSYPKFDDVSIDLGATLGGKTVQVRFRIATDEAGGADGWDIDDITFSGIDNAPFSGLVANTKPCKAPPSTTKPGATVPLAKGCGCTSTSDSAPLAGLGLACALFATRRRWARGSR